MCGPCPARPPSEPDGKRRSGLALLLVRDDELSWWEAQVAAAAQLGERAQQQIAKTQRWLVLLAATLSWYWAEVRRRIDELELSAAAERVGYRRLLPGLYWESAAERGRDAERRQRLRQLASRLLRRVRWDRGPLSRLTAEQQAEVKKVVGEAAVLFVRKTDRGVEVFKSKNWVEHSR